MKTATSQSLKGNNSFHAAGIGTAIISFFIAFIILSFAGCSREYERGHSPVVSPHSSVPYAGQDPLSRRNNDGVRSPETTKYVPVTNATPKFLALVDALKELKEFETPDGVDPSIFAQLKSTLSDQLSSLHSQLQTGRFASKPPAGEENRVDDLTLTDNRDGSYTLTWTYKNVGDYDQNGIINIGDITPLAQHFLESADPTNRWIDGDGNGIINIADTAPIAENYFSEVSGYFIMHSKTRDGPFGVLDSVVLATGEEIPEIRFTYRLSTNSFKFLSVVPVDLQGNRGENSNTVEKEFSPIAKMSAKPTYGPAPLAVHFDASVSSDPDGTIVKFEWDWEGDSVFDADTGAEPTASHTYDSPGNFSPTVRVTDDEGFADTATTAVQVSEPPNKPPRLLFLVRHTSGDAPLDVELDLSPSYDADGAIALLEVDWENDGMWDYVGPFVQVISHVYEVPSIYNLTIRLTDDDGATTTKSIVVTVGSYILPPKAVYATDALFDDKIRVTWAEPENAIPSGYRVYRSTSLNGVYTYQASVEGRTFWDDTEVPSTQKYWYKLKSFKVGLPETDFSEADYGSKAPPGQWVHTWGTDGWDFATGAALDGNGDLYLSGVVDTEELGEAVLLLKFSSSGNLLWARAWKLTNLENREAGIAIDPSGNLYVSAFSGIADPLVLLKWSASGELLWQRMWRLDYMSGGTSAITTDTQGNAYVLGLWHGATENEGPVLMKFSPSGEPEWQFAMYGRDVNLSQIAADSNGNIWACGLIGTSFGRGVMLAKFSPSGELLLLYAIDVDRNDFVPFDLALDQNENIYIAGELDLRTEDDRDAFLLKILPSGEILWVRTWGGDKEDRSNAVVVDANGDVYVGGYTFSFNANSSDVFMLKYTSYGDLVLQKTWGGAGQELAFDLVGGAGNYFYLVGEAGNIYGSWEDQTGKEGSLELTSVPVMATWEPINGEVTSPQGIEAMVEGILDEGGGYLDALVMKLSTSFQ